MKPLSMEGGGEEDKSCSGRGQNKKIKRITTEKKFKKGLVGSEDERDNNIKDKKVALVGVGQKIN